ncbi:MAG TPA: hypothetical protein VH054_23390 [Polyangiaceae bacterium]|jgi:hypothetical protein|nr:hypothetical protein [Polyangiaceae bacterium]
MRFALFFVPFVIAASCGGVISGGTDAGSDASSTCSTDSDCPKGDACLFPVNGGCSATRACLLANVECKGLPACACDGTDVSACGPGAIKPVAHSGPCEGPPPSCASGLACEVCDVTGFAVTPQVKPNVATNACTAQDISSFVTACLDASATQQTCSAWQESDAGACGACILTPITSATWGPVVCESSSCAINTGGCMDIVSGQIAIENGTNGSCGDLTNANEECVSYACGACTTPSDSETCTDDAEQVECKSYFDAEHSASACASVDAGASTCSPQNDADWAAFINLFCGTGP